MQSKITPAKVIGLLNLGRPSKSTDSAFDEAFNGRFRQECRNESWFQSLEDTRSHADLHLAAIGVLADGGLRKHDPR